MTNRRKKQRVRRSQANAINKVYVKKHFKKILKKSKIAVPPVCSIPIILASHTLSHKTLYASIASVNAAIAWMKSVTGSE